MGHKAYKGFGRDCAIGLLLASKTQDVELGTLRHVKIEINILSQFKAYQSR